MFIVTPEWFNKIYSEFEKTKQGKQLLKLTGISRDKFDFIKIMNDYFYENKDITIDPNANIGNAKNNKNFVGEFSKVYNKYYSFIEMHKFMFEMGISQKEIEEIIKNIISGYYYPHDQTTWATLPYCVAVSTYPIMVEGRPYGQLHSLPPKRTQSFVGQVIEYVIDLSQEFAGAVALGDFIINYVYYEIQEQLSDKEIENHFQSMVHVFNNGFRVGSQSPFTNISFMDRPAIRNTFKDYYYPNGDSPLDEKYLEEIMRIQYIFMNFIAKKDPKTGSPLRFPVATCNITIENNQIIDKEFFEKVCELNREGIFNIYITDNEKARVASCCFHPNQKVLVKSSTKGIELVKIGEFVERPAQERSNWKVYHNGSWIKAKRVKVPYNHKWYKITTSNKKQLIVTDDHIHVTLDGEKKTTDLKIGDYLMFSTYPVVTTKEKEYCNYDYLDGLIVGAFLGDGSYRKDHKDEFNGIVFCLNPEKFQTLKPIIEIVANRIDENANFYVYSQRETSITLTVSSKQFLKFITKFVGGTYNYEKYPILDAVLRCSYAFRKGLIDGLYLTDGGNSNRIYTTSEKMVENLEVIFTSLGIPTVIDVSDCRDEPVIIRGQEFSRNFKLYCIRFYSISHTRDYVDLYKIHNNSIYFKIVKIEEMDNTEEFAYCFEVKNQNEPYFTLPNGIITHNCRLINDITELMKFKGIDSFGNGGVQLGSDRVVTINLPRIAIESVIKKIDVKKLLSYHFDKVVKILISHRLLIKDRIDKGFLKFFKPLHWLDLDKMFYSTVGLVGFYEFSQILGYDLLTEKGRKFLADILKFLNDKLMENATKYGVPLNMEQVPAESSAITLAKKDNVLYNTGYVMYANQFIPLWVEIPLTERIKIDGEFDEYFGGGVISHLNVGSVLTKEQMTKVIQFAIQSGLKHFAINPKFSICKNNHVFIGDKCPTCGEEVIDYITRIVGYFVPVSQWVNERKNWEFSLRKWVDKV